MQLVCQTKIRGKRRDHGHDRTRHTAHGRPFGSPGPSRTHRSHPPVSTEELHVPLEPGTPPFFREGTPPEIDGEIFRDFLEQRHE